ncbi:MAG TPA: CGNR zinc finger domain-containing protein [Solirubrobacteraceae bacterium]|jgi:predicted RNA-binding Zn ribbon-like protein|nr:CGNR zinc finger domain-containing protein [Solirubrobacteraceae bacterium]
MAVDKRTVMEVEFVSQAPGGLETVREFVNTYDVDDGTDALATPDALARWLREHGLLDEDEDAGATRADVRRAAALRDSLREVLLGHHGGYEIDPAALAGIEDAARRARLELRFGPDGTARPEPARGGVDGALGRLLALVAEAQAGGTWQRLKVCPADDCQWAFYDRSRNRSAVWCNMAVCGNRAKVRSYRERHAHRAV